MFYKIKKESVEFILILAFIISLPIKEPINSFSFILITVYSLYNYIKFKRFEKTILIKLVPLIIYFSLVLISFLYSSNKAYSLKFISRFLPFLLFPFIFSIINLTNREINRIFKFFIFWMSTLAFYSHTRVLINLYQNNDTLFDLFNLNYSYISLAKTIDIHSTYYALLMLFSILFILNIIILEKNRKKIIFYCILLSYQSFFIFHLSTRTPIVALFILLSIFIIYLFFKRKQPRKGIFALLFLFTITVFLAYNVRAVRYRFQQLIGFTFSDGTHYDDGINKIKQWKSAIDANNNFLLGNSVADADYTIIKSNLEHGLTMYAQREYNAHNQFIQTFVGLGFFGFTTLMFLFVFLFRYFYINKIFLGYAGILLFFILFQTEAYLQRQIGIMFFSFFVGILIKKGLKVNIQNK